MCINEQCAGLKEAYYCFIGATVKGGIDCSKQ